MSYWILALRESFEIPSTSTGLGVADDRLDELAAMAKVDSTGPGNPMPVDAAAMRRIYDAAMAGTL